MDKVKHFTVSFFLGIGQMVMEEAWHNWIINTGYFVMCFGLFFGKEIYDTQKENPTGFSWMDIFFDIFGFVFGMGVGSWLINVFA